MVTTERNSIPGCRVLSLGVMRYIPVAAPAYLKRYLPESFTAESVALAPSLAWNRDDALQDMLLRKAFRRAFTRPVHYVPTAEGFGAAVRAGSDGECTQSSWPLRRWQTGRSSRSLMRTSTCRCIGSAGS